MRVLGSSLLITAVLLRPISAVRNDDLTNSSGSLVTTTLSHVYGNETYISTTTSTSSTPPKVPTLTPPTSIARPTLTTTCIHQDQEATITSISIIFSSTVTFTGDPADYIPPYDPIVLPDYCKDTVGPFPSSSRTEPFLNKPTVTFITTEKNPSVIYEPDNIPEYTLPNTRPVVNPGTSKDSTKQRPDPTTRRPPPVFTVTAGQSQVIIGTSTVSNLKPGQTTTIVAGGGTFTIFPTAVVGEGVTVVKQAPVEQPTAVFPQPTSADVGGIGVSVSGSIIVADGTTLTVPPQGLSTVLDGRTISAGPGNIVVGDETLSVSSSPAQETNVFVQGGELLTAIGSSIVVLHSTTIMYGSGIDLTTFVADDDTIIIDESGIIIHDSTLGGPDAESTDTEYGLVGGVTITEIGSTIIVIGDQTFTIGSDVDTITTLIGGETLTIGPDGVTFGTLTLDHANDHTVVTTIKPSGTWLDDFPTETGAVGHGSGNGDGDGDGDEDEDDGAAILVPASITVLCIAAGVLALILT